MRILTRTALPAALALVMAVSGCAQKVSSNPGPTGPTTSAPSAAPTRTGTATKTARPAKTPTKAPTGNGDGEGDDTPATAGGGICSDLDATAVGAVLGGTVTGAALPGHGCLFSQADDAAPTASFVEASFAQTPGGMDGAKTDATSSVEGDPVDLTGIGDEAFSVTGTAFGGPDFNGAGAVRVGDRLIIIDLSQSTGLSRAKVKALVVGLLRLSADKLS